MTFGAHNPKDFRIADFGDAVPTFADDLAAVIPHGWTTHLVFALSQTPASTDRDFPTERRVVARLIVPTELIRQIGQQLVADEAGSTVRATPVRAVH